MKRNAKQAQKFFPFIIVALLILTIFTVISPSTRAIQELDDQTICYMVPEDDYSYQIPDFEMWAKENTIYQNTWVMGDEINGGLYASMELIPVSFVFDGVNPAQFDYIVHIRAVADPTYRVPYVYGITKDSPVGIHSVNLYMTYDELDSDDPNKRSKVTGLSGEDNLEESSLYSAIYNYPNEFASGWTLESRDPGEESYTSDITTFTDAFIAEHFYSEKCRAAIVGTIIEGMSLLISGGLSSPWSGIVGTVFSVSTLFATPYVEPTLDV
ncbi:MAG: hypothetical protein PHU53_00555 [Thermoplasmata archaeon]|nr:hypothetical protein [Thermoplasmata archaeon]